MSAVSGKPSPDEAFMALALREARRAGRLGEVPVGALVVEPRTGAVIGRGHNLTIARHDPTAHAEVVALRRAGRRAGNHRLGGTVLYVTLEPCLLCLGAIVHARVARVVYGAPDPKRGALAAARTRKVASLLHHRFQVTGGVLAEEGARLLLDFFHGRRGPRRLAPPHGRLLD
ncbi:MAG TPA: tRNA adenosine(34) deaminase TadA [Candidatus Polarisedimenticolia bacterium]|nr:tRNA adenosine(34) deaminase TadA [Candidatus Polarisedimenticolia bacterium]